MIKNIQLYAERHSGTNWFEELCNKNFKVHKDILQLGHKHWFPDIRKIDEANLEEYLFVFLTRDPYDWVKAMHESPHHVHPMLGANNLYDFTSGEYRCVMLPVNDYDGINSEQYLERNPETYERFENLLEMRTYKYKYFLNLKKIVPNYIHIRYEDLVTKFNKFIVRISNEFDISMNHEKVRGHSHGKTPKKLDRRTIKFINENLDWSIEEKVGYERNRTH